jgi:hypothetical protein
MSTNNLYAETAAPTATTPKPSAASAATQAIADSLYGAPAARMVDQVLTPEIAALRESQPARALYADADQLGQGPRELAVAIDPMADEATITSRASSLASVAVDTGMTRDDVAQLAAFARQYASSPPSDEEQAAHARTAVLALRETYGPRFDDAMQAARGLAQRDHRFAALLDKSRLGNHRG